MLQIVLLVSLQTLWARIFFSVWLAFPCIFHWFSFIFLTFPLFSTSFCWFSFFLQLFFPHFPSFSSLCLCFPSGFRWLSLSFHWFCFVFLIHVFICFLVFAISLCFYFSCPSCFPVSCVAQASFGFTAFSSLFFCFYLGYASFVSPFSLVVLPVPEFLFFPPLVFVRCPHFFLLQHILLLLLVVGGGCCCCLGLFCELTATVLVNDVAVLLTLDEPEAGGQPLKKHRWGARGRAQRLPPQCVPCCSLLFARACFCFLLLLLLIDTMLSLKKSRL